MANLFSFAATLFYSVLWVFLLAGLALGDTSKPNIIFVLTDDLDTEYPTGGWIDHFPRLQQVLASQGTTFANHHVSLSLCCPSRTTMLRGQYAHNTKVFSNSGAYGGFQAAHGAGLEDSTVATWLQGAGYKTAFFGKYLNGYLSGKDKEYVPPGWTEWYGGEANLYRQYDYDLNENGKLVHYGSNPTDYLQDVLQSKVVDFIQRQAANPNGPSFFVWLATISPHGPSTAAPRYADAFADVALPQGPSFNQKDVSSYLGGLRATPLLTTKDLEELQLRYRQRLKSMLAVEDTVIGIVNALAITGKLNNTFLLFTSDNGFHLGQHRLHAGKNTGFEEDLRVPLIVRGPGIPAGTVLPHLTGNVDFAPTFAELAGIRPPKFVDGRSLVPLLRERPIPIERWRQAFLLENGPTAQIPFPFHGVHTARYVYLEYPIVNERELYDLRKDPYQLQNVADSQHRGIMRQLSRRLKKLSTCAGQDCRDAE